MLKFILFLMSLSAVANLHVRFESAEHLLAGDQILLQKVSKRLRVPNGLVLSFGELIALGDFYGLLGAPISQTHSKSEQRARFLKAFHTLAQEAVSVEEAKRIVEAIQTEKKTILDGLSKGRSFHDIYLGMSDQQPILWNCLTGGACSGSFWWLSPGRYLLLAEQDLDHFGQDAVVSYRAGHGVALDTAAQAGKTQNLAGLEKAYAMEAFACHFLTDRFSSGHMRIPRVEMRELVTPGVLGSFLVTFMHDEESEHGLHVHNNLGEHWLAYGDHFHLDSRNQENAAHMQKAMQMSVDQVYAAFSEADAGPYLESSSVLEQIPYADEIQAETVQDIAPMFHWDSKTKKLLRRVNLKDPHAAQWTEDWAGWSTLLILKK